MGSTNNSTKKDVVKTPNNPAAKDLNAVERDPPVTDMVSQDMGRPLSEEETTNIEALSTQMLNQGMSAKQAMGITDEMLEGIYSFGYRLYNNGKYMQAAPVFRLLILIDPMQAKYLMGLAACFHMTKEYQSALTTYSLCSLIDMNDPLPYYHSSDCYLQIGHQEMALKSLELSIKKMKGRAEYANLCARAEMHYEALKEGFSYTPDTNVAQIKPEAMKKTA